MKKHKEIIILFIISLFFLYPSIGGYFATHDGEAHVARIPQYIQAFSDGQIPPRWAKDLNYGFGSPLFIFFYPLPYYIMSLFHLSGFSLENSFLLLQGLSFILGSVFFYLWTSQMFKKKIALLSSIIYLTLPYRFLTMYVRGGIGEHFAFSFIPLLFYLIEKSIKKISVPKIIFGSLIYALLILSHNALSLIFTPIFIVYALIRSKTAAFYSLLIILQGLILTAFFWIPSLYESKYTNGLFYFENMYWEHFPDISKYIYSSWGFGPDVNQSGGLSPQLGMVPALIMFLTLFIFGKQLFTKKISKQTMIVFFWFVVFLFGLFIGTSYSSLLWEKIDFLKKFQFPWRFVVLPAFSAAAVSPFLFSKIENIKIVYLIAFSALIFSIPFAKVKKYIYYPESYYYSYKGSTYFRNEATTIWSAGDPNDNPKQPVEIIAGDGNIQNLNKKSNIHAFTASAKTPMTVIDNTIYYPGWKVLANNKEVPIQFQDINHRGLITFNVPKGENNVIVRFEETKVRKISDFISLAGLSMLFILSLLPFRKRLDKFR